VKSLSQKDVSRFKKYVTKWATNFNLASWEILQDCSSDNFQRYAKCEADSESKRAKITLFKDWNIASDDKAIEQTACHEVLHIVLAPLMDLAGERYTTEKQLEDAEHDIIRTLVKIFVKP